MTELSDTPIDTVAKEIDSRVEEYAKAGSDNHRFAFWHDVGVTGLGALATVLLGVAEIADDSPVSKVLRIVVLFVTGSVTVFVACEQFFKFKAKAQAYHSAAAQLMTLKRRVDRASRSEVPIEQVQRLTEDFDRIAGSVDPVWPDATVWKSTGLARYGPLALLLVVAAFLAMAIAVAMAPAR